MLKLYKLYKCPVDVKMHLVKTLVLPHLTYPTIPLHLACKTNMLKLQAVQNKALRFVYGVKWDDFITSKSLHLEHKYKMLPINQTLYWRARKLWEGIEADIAGNASMLDQILKLPQSTKEDRFFPSSYNAAMLQSEPPPLFARGRDD